MLKKIKIKNDDIINSKEIQNIFPNKNNWILCNNVLNNLPYLIYPNGAFLLNNNDELININNETILIKNNKTKKSLTHKKYDIDDYLLIDKYITLKNNEKNYHPIKAIVRLEKRYKTYMIGLNNITDIYFSEKNKKYLFDFVCVDFENMYYLKKKFDFKI